MPDIQLTSDDKTVERLDSFARVLEWIRSMPKPSRERFLGAITECCDEVQEVVASMLSVIKMPSATEEERLQALASIAEALSLNPDELRQHTESDQDPFAQIADARAKLAQVTSVPTRPDSMQAAFADRLRDIMEAKRISQNELADRVGCSQPAISQMLTRQCRPQKKTILKLADALGVASSALWPDIEVAEALDAVDSFQQDDYTMTEAEAKALGEDSKRNAPKIPAKPLPARRS